jgi:hypothetical protein
LSEGVHTLYVQEQNPEGQWSDVGAFSLLVDLTAPVERALTITLGWDPNAEPDLLGYRVYCATGSHGPAYAVHSEVQGRTNQTIGDLKRANIHSFAVTAYDTEDLESDFSQDVFVVPAILEDIETGHQLYGYHPHIRMTLAGVPSSVTEMNVAEDMDFTVNCTGWRPFTPRSVFRLASSVDREREIFVKFRDASLRESGWATGRITLDAAALIRGGDMNLDSNVNLLDAILLLQVMVKGVSPPSESGAKLDAPLGMAEVLLILQKEASVEK